MATSTAASDITILADGEATVGGAIDGASVIVDPAGLEAATGWHLEDRGLCRGDVCVPTGGASVTTDGGVIDLTLVAELLDRPIAADVATGTVALGEPRSRRRTTLQDLVAPDFTLPDLNGDDQDFSQWQGRRRLLVAFASW